ncbi:unnamed protein product [Chrysoparadoxa australica]
MLRSENQPPSELLQHDSQAEGEPPEALQPAFDTVVEPGLVRDIRYQSPESVEQTEFRGHTTLRIVGSAVASGSSDYAPAVLFISIMVGYFLLRQALRGKMAAPSLLRSPSSPVSRVSTPRNRTFECRVIAQGGLVVNHGSDPKTSALSQLPYNTLVTADRRVRTRDGEARLHITTPVEGWVTERSDTIHLSGTPPVSPARSRSPLRGGSADLCASIGEDAPVDAVPLMTGYNVRRLVQEAESEAPVFLPLRRRGCSAMDALNLTEEWNHCGDERWRFTKRVVASVGAPVKSAILVRMEPGQKIGPQKETLSNRATVRLLLPITRDSSLTMVVPGKKWRLREGTLWFVNVRRMSTLENKNTQGQLVLCLDVASNLAMQEAISMPSSVSLPTCPADVSRMKQRRPRRASRGSSQGKPRPLPPPMPGQPVSIGPNSRSGAVTLKKGAPPAATIGS